MLRVQLPSLVAISGRHACLTWRHGQLRQGKCIIITIQGPQAASLLLSKSTHVLWTSELIIIG